VYLQKNYTLRINLRDSNMSLRSQLGQILWNFENTHEINP
jgi:hypothetical protein